MFSFDVKKIVLVEQDDKKVLNQFIKQLEACFSRLDQRAYDSFFSSGFKKNKIKKALSDLAGHLHYLKNSFEQEHITPEVVSHCFIKISNAIVIINELDRPELKSFCRQLQDLIVNCAVRLNPALMRVIQKNYEQHAPDLFKIINHTVAVLLDFATVNSAPRLDAKVDIISSVLAEAKACRDNANDVIAKSVAIRQRIDLQQEQLQKSQAVFAEKMQGYRSTIDAANKNIAAYKAKIAAAIFQQQLKLSKPLVRQLSFFHMKITSYGHQVTAQLQVYATTLSALKKEAEKIKSIIAIDFAPSLHLLNLQARDLEEDLSIARANQHAGKCEIYYTSEESCFDLGYTCRSTCNHFNVKRETWVPDKAARAQARRDEIKLDQQLNDNREESDKITANWRYALITNQRLAELELKQVTLVKTHEAKQLDEDAKAVNTAIMVIDRAVGSLLKGSVEEKVQNVNRYLFSLWAPEHNQLLKQNINWLRRYEQAWKNVLSQIFFDSQKPDDIAFLIASYVETVPRFPDPDSISKLADAAARRLNPSV